MLTRKEEREYLLAETDKAIERNLKAIEEYPEEKTLELTLESLYAKRQKLQETLNVLNR